MMKKIIFTSALLLASTLTGVATAACPTSGQVVDATTATQEKATILFGGDLGKNKFVNVGGLILTKGTGQPNTINATSVANGFANLPNNGPTSGSSVTGASWSGQFLTGWGSGVQSGNAVTFTYATSGNVTDFPSPSKDDNQFTLGITRTQGSAGGGALSALLIGNTVCVGAPGNWQAQEYHKSGGDLIDWKKGANDPIDKTASVGSWTITGTGSATRVNYTYGSTTYNDAVYDIGSGSYSFCDQNGNVTTAIYIKSGQVGCQ